MKFFIKLDLYLGIPFGLSTAIPLILSSKGVSYADQGAFSFAYWPLALKILWVSKIKVSLNRLIILVFYFILIGTSSRFHLF